jgi:hypothetical protein
MKTKITHSTILLTLIMFFSPLYYKIAGSEANAQIVTIPDANFVTCLTLNYPK